jgi:hypothetical protein
MRPATAPAASSAVAQPRAAVGRAQRATDNALTTRRSTTRSRRAEPRRPSASDRTAAQGSPQRCRKRNGTGEDLLEVHVVRHRPLGVAAALEDSLTAATGGLRSATVKCGRSARGLDCTRRPTICQTLACAAAIDRPAEQSDYCNEWRRMRTAKRNGQSTATEWAGGRVRGAGVVGPTRRGLPQYSPREREPGGPQRREQRPVGVGDRARALVVHDALAHRRRGAQVRHLLQRVPAGHHSREYP